MDSIHSGTCASSLRNDKPSRSNCTPLALATPVEAPAPWKDCCHALDGGPLSGTRHKTESCVVGGPDLVITMVSLYDTQDRRRRAGERRHGEDRRGPVRGPFRQRGQ